MRFRVITLTLNLILLTTSTLVASGLSSGRSVGMAQAYTAVARGAESAFWNPANLGFSKSSEICLMVFSLGVNASNNAFNLEQYHRYNGAFLTPEDKQTILNLIPSRGFNLSMNGEVLFLGISWHNLACNVSWKGTSGLFLPRDPFRTLLFGNEINDTILLSGSDGEALTSVDLALSYGRSIWKKGEKDVLCGVTARFIRGLDYQKVKEAEGEVFTLETGVNGDGDFVIQSAHGGNGYGVDLGLALKYKENWTFGLSFVNLINQIKWSQGAEKRGYQVRIDSLLAENFDVDSMVMDRSYTESISPFSTRIPISVQVGVAYQLRRTLLAFDLEGVLKDVMGLGKKLSASFGAEYGCLSWLYVRGGISLNKDEGVSVTSGLGFKQGIYNLDIAVASQKGAWLTKSKGICLTVSNGFHF